MAMPIRDAQGKVIGVLTGVTDLGKHSFLDQITQNTYGKTGGYFVIAVQHRLVVTATDKSRVMQALPAPASTLPSTALPVAMRVMPFWSIPLVSACCLRPRWFLLRVGR